MKTISKYSIESNLSNIDYKLKLLRREAENLYDAVLNNKTLEFDEEDYEDCYLNLVNDYDGSIFEVHPTKIDVEGIHSIDMEGNELFYPISITELHETRDVLELIKLISGL